MTGAAKTTRAHWTTRRRAGEEAAICLVDRLVTAPESQRAFHRRTQRSFLKSADDQTRYGVRFGLAMLIYTAVSALKQQVTDTATADPTRGAGPVTMAAAGLLRRAGDADTPLEFFDGICRESVVPAGEVTDDDDTLLLAAVAAVELVLTRQFRDDPAARLAAWVQLTTPWHAGTWLGGGESSGENLSTATVRTDSQ